MFFKDEKYEVILQRISFRLVVLGLTKVTARHHNKGDFIMITNIKYELYQAKIESNIAFMPYDFLVKRKEDNPINSNNYDKVVIGQLMIADSDIDVLNRLFKEFNSDSPRNFRSMSVSDVVIVTYTENEYICTKAYYCDSFGWKELDIKEYFGLTT